MQILCTSLSPCRHGSSHAWKSTRIVRHSRDHVPVVGPISTCSFLSDFITRTSVSIDQRFRRTGSATMYEHKTALVSENTTDSRPVRSNVRLSEVVVELVSGHPRPPSVRTPVYCGCPCLDPPTGVLRCQAGWHRRQSANTFCGGWSREVMWSSCERFTYVEGSDIKRLWLIWN